MSRRGIAALLTMVVAVGALSSTSTGPASAAVASGNGRIVYEVDWSEGTDIFSVRPDGTDNTRLTFSRTSGDPIWSPFGQRIAYERAGAVWVMQADGSGKQRLIDGHLVGWMPGGGRILVATGLGTDGVDPVWELVRLSTGGVEGFSIDLPLVAGLEPPYDSYTDWSYVSRAILSPNGRRLLLTLNREDDDGDGYGYPFGTFYTVRLDRSGLHRVGDVYYPGVGSAGWAPDGRQFVYAWAEPREGCHDGVRSLRLDGTSGAAEFTRPCFETDPAWSPDGGLIAFGATASWGDPPATLEISSLDGSRMTTVLSSTDHWYYHPDWRRTP